MPTPPASPEDSPALWGRGVTGSADCPLLASLKDGLVGTGRPWALTLPALALWFAWAVGLTDTPTLPMSPGGSTSLRPVSERH